MVAAGQILAGKYKLLRLLGDGGMGSVYEGEHVVLGTRVAVKVLHSDLARRPGLIERFRQEAMVAARIRSDHVVHVMDVESSPDGLAYMVMELLEGEPLSAVLDRERKLSEPVACEYTKQILLALEAAHALGVVHRDLKPENVFITYSGARPVLKLIDFGIAKLRQEGVKNLTVAGVLMGTAEYMAPEQAYSADRVDVRADIYAVGVMLYEMLAGVRPVAGDDGRIIAVKVERGQVTPLVHAAPGVTPELAGLVHRAMAFRPEIRFASAAEMRLALELAQAGHPPRTGAMPAMVDPGAKAGTGTMMGAPVQAVLGAHAPARAQHAQPRAEAQAPGQPRDAFALAPTPLAGHGTIVAPPDGEPQQVAMSPYPGSATPGYLAPTGSGARGRRSGFPWPVLVVPLVLGAVAAGVFFTVDGSPAPPAPTTLVLTPPPLPPQIATVAPTPLPTTPPLDTNTPPLVPTATPTVAPTPRPSTNPPPSAADASTPPPPLVPLPSFTIPPIPSFQIPTAWPSAGGFPGFPFPAAPTASSPGPAPTNTPGY